MSHSNKNKQASLSIVVPVVKVQVYVYGQDIPIQGNYLVVIITCVCDEWGNCCFDKCMSLFDIVSHAICI